MSKIVNLSRKKMLMNLN